MQSHDSIIGTLAFSPDNRRLASGSWDKTAQVWDIALNKQIGTLNGFPYYVTHLTHASHKYGRGVPRPYEENCDGLRKVSYVTDIQFSPDSAKLFTASSENYALQMWDANTFTELKTIVQSGGIDTMDISPDGNCIIAAYRPAGTSGGHSLNLIDLKSGSVATFPHTYKGEFTQLVFNAEGTLIATAGLDNTARIWDFVTRTQQKVFHDTSSVTSVAFNHDSTILATATGDFNPEEDDQITLWDIATEQPVKILEGHKENITHSPYAIRHNFPRRDEARR